MHLPCSTVLGVLGPSRPLIVLLTGDWRPSPLAADAGRCRRWRPWLRAAHAERDGSRNSQPPPLTARMESARLLAVVLSFLYRLVHRAFGLLGLARRDAIAKDAEILVLGHELAVLWREVGRARFTWSDRVVITLLQVSSEERGGRHCSSRRRRSSICTAVSSLDAGPIPTGDPATTTWTRDRRAHRGSHPGEPPVGIPTHRRRARHARCHPLQGSVATVAGRYGLPRAPRRGGRARHSSSPPRPRGSSRPTSSVSTR